MRKVKLYYLFFAVIAFACTKVKESVSEDSRPNVLILLADDMGYADLACYGGKALTPNLDQLAKDGIMFTDFYSAAPNCSPARAGLLTGIPPSIVGMYNYRPPGHPLHLRDEEVTIAEVLKKEAYQTVHLGKWHLGALPQDTSLNHPQPHDQGFDYSLGTQNNAQPSHLNPVNFVRNGIPQGEMKGYSCQILADEAMGWLEDHHKKENPFFMYLAFHEPHRKVASPPGLVAKYDSLPVTDAEYLANIENLDLAVGRLIQYLKEQELFENTLILFTSDNGSYRQASNGDLRAVKSYVYEGGIRVPGIFHGPELDQGNKVIHEAAGFVDIMPTLCDLLKVDSPMKNRWAGTSILPLLRGEKIQRKKPLFWFFYRTSPEMAMRIGQYSILGKDFDTIAMTHQFASQDMEYIRKMSFQEFELYDLEKDKGQRENIFPDSPEKEELRDLLKQHLGQIQETGHYWENLPNLNNRKKLKRDWVKYDFP